MIEPRRSARTYHTWTHDSTRWDRYAPRAGDIVIATPPKCGTTWTQRIVSLLVFQSPAPCPVMEVSPWIDARFTIPLEPMLQLIEAQTHRRFLKSHLPLDGLPIYDEVRYIHVARDPRDACMSFFNHYSGLTPLAFEAIAANAPPELGPVPRDVDDVRTFWRDWFTRGSQPGAQDGFPDLSFVDFETSYWRERRRENLLLVHYNDLKADLDGEMRRIAAFLGIETPAALWPKLVEAASFAAMKRDGAILLGPLNAMFEGGSDRFMFKGSNGRWRDELSADDLALADKLAARFSPGLGRWLEGGRLAAGDPVTSAE
ncbi:MAG: sulfotransferase domain-containing protein [Myxococcota bacterium]